MTDSAVREGLPRTARATEALKRRRVERLAREVWARMDELSDEMIVNMTIGMFGWVEERGLWDSVNEKWEKLNGA